MDDAAVPRARRGLGFFPDAVVIRSRSPPRARPAAAAVGEMPLPTAEPWHALKQWHMNPSGHGGQRAPPVFVPAENAYDELGRSVADGYGVDVDVDDAEDESVAVDQGKMAGGDVANWYRSLASASASRAGTPSAPVAAELSVTRKPPDTSSRPSQSMSPTPTPTGPTAASSRMASPAPAPAPVRVHRSEWFIRRALLASSKTAPAVPSPPPRPSSIGGMLNIAAAKPAPPPMPRYVLGPENAGYARLESLGWRGGGLGRPEGWEQDRPGKSERSISEPASEGTDGVVDLTHSSDEDEFDEEGEEEARHGPGRTAPIATALKLDRLGLGRAAPHKRVTHTSAEIARAQRRARGGKGPTTKSQPEASKKQKRRWAEHDRRDREERARIAASLQ